MTPNEQAFVDAMVAYRLAERKEGRARQRTYDLEKATFAAQEKLNAARKAVIGHDRMLNTDYERNLLFRLIGEADKRVKENQ